MALLPATARFRTKRRHRINAKGPAGGQHNRPTERRKIENTKHDRDDRRRGLYTALAGSRSQLSEGFSACSIV